MEFFHILNRGVDKRNIFLENNDYYRFIHDLFEFNNKDYVDTGFRNYSVKKSKIPQERKPRKLLVHIHCFVLMPNHYHLLLTPLKENAISKFMHKLNKGYARYFNEKYQRKGALFESRYKSIRITNEKHFKHLPYYIHLNPLDLITPQWRQKELRNYKKAIKFLEKYRWSSHLDYLGKNNFPSVTYRDFFLEYFGGHKEYKNSIYNWLKNLKTGTLKNLKDFLLE